VVHVVIGDGAGCRPCPVFPLITGTGGSDSLAYVRMGGTVDSAAGEIRCQHVGEAGHKNLMDTTGSRRTKFEQLYEEYRLPVLAYCTRRVGPSDAPDACSETFLVAWRRLDDLPAEPKTLPYLYGIAGKVVSNQLRSFRRHPGWSCNSSWRITGNMRSSLHRTRWRICADMGGAKRSVSRLGGVRRMDRFPSRE